MRSLTRAAAVAAGLLALVACSPAAPPTVDTSADQAAIHNGSIAWVDAYNAGDADKIASMYADDGVMMPPDAPSVTGSAAMREFIAADIAAAKAAGLMFMLGPDALGVAGDLAWHSGTFMIHDASGGVVVTGKYVEVWRKTNGTWQIIRDIWSSDAPAAPPAGPDTPAE